MANIGRVLDKNFLDKLSTSVNQELDPENSDHKELINYWRQNPKTMAAIVTAQESEDVIMGLRDSNKLIVTFMSEITCNYCKELKNKFQPEDRLFEMSMEEDLHKLKFTKKEDPKKLSLSIAKITMRYKHALPDSKKPAHV